MTSSDVNDEEGSSHSNKRNNGTCGQQWRSIKEDLRLLCGGYENYLCMWVVAMPQRRNSLHAENDFAQPWHTITQHDAAVKALARSFVCRHNLQQVVT